MPFFPTPSTASTLRYELVSDFLYLPIFDAITLTSSIFYCQVAQPPFTEPSDVLFLRAGGYGFRVCYVDRVALVDKWAGIWVAFMQLDFKWKGLFKEITNEKHGPIEAFIGSFVIIIVNF